MSSNDATTVLNHQDEDKDIYRDMYIYKDSTRMGARTSSRTRKLAHRLLLTLRPPIATAAVANYSIAAYISKKEPKSQCTKCYPVISLDCTNSNKFRHSTNKPLLPTSLYKCEQDRNRQRGARPYTMAARKAEGSGYQSTELTLDGSREI